MNTNAVVQSVLDGEWPVDEADPHYAIHEVRVKEYAPCTMLVQTSGTPISLGEPMFAVMDTERLRDFAGEYGVGPADDTPREVYVYNWVDRAQGPMVFDVGWMVDEPTAEVRSRATAEGFVFKTYDATTVASIAYVGPFPYQPNSGWENLDWERRARDRGLVYTERLYRELYHVYDWDDHRHVVEVQVEIEVPNTTE